MRLATVTLGGRVTGTEIAETILTLNADPSWCLELNVLWDATAISELLLEASDQRLFVDLHRRCAEANPPLLEIIRVRRDLDRAMPRIYAVLMKAASWTSARRRRRRATGSRSPD